MDPKYTPIDSMESLPEMIDDNEVIESADYTPFETTPVGTYVSPTRKIYVKDNTKGLSIQVELTGGVVNVDTGRTYNSKFPLKAYLNDSQFERKGRPGKTSELAEYLRAFGFDTRGMTRAQTKEALQESQSQPVEVFIGWTNKKEKLPNGTWDDSAPKLKTKDFFISDGNGGGHYIPTVTIDGRTFKARPRVTSFARAKAEY